MVGIDFKMPNTCGECPCCIHTADEKRYIGYCNTSDDDYYCKALDRFMEYDKVDGGTDILGKPSDCPLVEVIPKTEYEATIKQLSNSVKTLQKANSKIAEAYDKLKSDYETRLKADMVAMLEDLDLQIDESAAYNREYAKIQRLIRDRIDKLKGEEDGNDKL